MRGAGHRISQPARGGREGHPVPLSSWLLPPAQAAAAGWLPPPLLAPGLTGCKLWLDKRSYASPTAMTVQLEYDYEVAKHGLQAPTAGASRVGPMHTGTPVQAGQVAYSNFCPFTTYHV